MAQGDGAVAIGSDGRSEVLPGGGEAHDDRRHTDADRKLARAAPTLAVAEDVPVAPVAIAARPLRFAGATLAGGDRFPAADGVRTGHRLQLGVRLLTKGCRHSVRNRSRLGEVIGGYRTIAAKAAQEARNRARPTVEKEIYMRSVVLWLLGVPISIIILLNIFGLLGH